MTWNGARVWRLAEPGLPIVLYAAIIAADKVFNVQSDVGAALVGVGLTAIILVWILVLAPRKPGSSVKPLFTPLYLPWGFVFILGGVFMMQLREPWKYHGVGVLVVGILYVLLGVFAVVRGSRQSTR